MEKVSCQKTGTLIDIEEALQVFHIADEICASVCTNYENCKDEFWKERNKDDRSI